MASQHERAVKSALKSVDELDALFARIGDSAHPRGVIVSTYRDARRIIGGLLEDISALIAALGALEVNITIRVREVIESGARIGLEQAARDASIWGLATPSGILPAFLIDELAETATQPVKAQRAQIVSLARTGRATRQEILGDGTTLGILSPARVSLPLTRAAVSAYGITHADTMQAVIDATPGQPQFLKQAVAAIDNKTTDCCLRVHGQTAPVGGMFTLTGEPRFADKLPSAPFHWNCRTATAMVHKAFADNALTNRMIESAQAERAARAAGKTAQGKYTSALTPRR